MTGDPFTIEHFRAWAKTLILDNGDPWILQPFQEAFITDVFAGFRECWLIIPEGNTKTTTLAGLALYHIEHQPYAWAPWAASSRDQAQIGFRQAAGFVQRSGLTDRFRCLEGYRRIDHGDSRLQIFSADDRTGDGVIPTLALIDELHRHRSLDLYRTWRGKLDKRDGQLCAISTAGEPGSEFEETREKIRQMGVARRDGSFTRAVLDSAAVLHEWAVPEGSSVDDIDVVKAANPHAGITTEMLAEKLASPSFSMPHWRRFVCNLPTRSEYAAIAEKEWHDAGGEEIPEGEPVWAGLDCGWRFDTTALVPLWTPTLERRILGPATVLVPPRDGSSLDIFKIERALAELHERNPISTLVLDVSDARDVAEWAEQELGCRVVERSMGLTAQAVDYARFMEGLRNGWLHHSDDPALTRHILNGITRVLPRGDAVFARPHEGRRTRDEGRRMIDGLVAATIVHSVAVGEMEQGAQSEPLVAML